MKKAVLAGNDITAGILCDYLAEDDRYQILGATVDDGFADRGGVDGLETVALSRLAVFLPPQQGVVIMAMGYNDINRSRESMFQRLKQMGYSIETYVHPDARVYADLPLGEGCVVLPSAVIEPGARLGANSVVWSNVTLAHHCSVAENCWIASGAVISGYAEIQRNTFVGVNATVVNKVKIGEYNIIGGGALITRSTKASSVYLARSGEEHRFSSQDYVKYVGV